jgi:hypothetical protein
MPLVTATTFGCPRLGNTEFSAGFDDVVSMRHWRIQNGWDPITRSPIHGPKPVDFRHTGLHVWLRHGYDKFPPASLPVDTHSSSSFNSISSLSQFYPAHHRSNSENSLPTSRLGMIMEKPTFLQLPKIKPLPNVVPPPQEVRMVVAHRGSGGSPEGAPAIGAMSDRTPLAIVSEALKGSHGVGHHQMGGARGYLASLERAVWL